MAKKYKHYLKDWEEAVNNLPDEQKLHLTLRIKTEDTTMERTKKKYRVRELSPLWWLEIVGASVLVGAFFELFFIACKLYA